MEKYDLIPGQLIHEGTITRENIFAPDPVDESEILNTHDSAYWNKLKTLSLNRSEERRTGFPLSASLVQRERIIAQGTIDCAGYALEHGAALNVAGGTHHAFTDRGEGFCLLNDIALAANHLLRTGRVKQVLVVDLDVHQGNGTAQIFEGNDAVFTFSMHGERNYPYQKQRSDLDIPLADGITDGDYLSVLHVQLPRLINRVKPDFIFYQSGVDILATDKLGRLGLTLKGCMERDLFVLKTCYSHNIPVAVVMGGGYSPEIRTIVEAHANTFRIVRDTFF